mgnify:CR=1 FL=1
MLFVYRILINFTLILSPAILIYRLFHKKEDPIRFKEKYCFFSKKKRKGKLIWFHGASVGEILSVIPILEKLEKDKKISQILVTSNTLSSSNIIQKYKFKKLTHQFFPVDNNYLSKKFLDYWKPSLAIFIDSEIWPNMILNLKKKKIPIFLLNARITQKSFYRWKTLGKFSNKIFQCINKSLVSNNETLKHLKFFGVKNVRYIGNLKFIQNKNKNLSLPKDLTNLIFKKTSWCASSTHEGEEYISMVVHKILKKKYRNLLCIIIPRHIHRSKQIIEMMEDNNLKIHCHSWNSQIPNKTDVYIVDTYGETEKFFNLIKIVFVGGSLINHGGQNPLEPARHGCNVLYGPHIDNFKNIYNYLDRIKVSKKVRGSKSLQKNIELLIRNKNKTKSVIKKVKKLGDNILILTMKEIERSLTK